MQLSFSEVKSNMRFAGILPNPMRSKLLTIIVQSYFSGICLIYFVSTLWFLLFHAEILIDYTNGFYFNACGWLVSAWYSIYLWRSDQYADLFAQLDTIIEKSMLNRSKIIQTRKIILISFIETRKPRSHGRTFLHKNYCEN